MILAPTSQFNKQITVEPPEPFYQGTVIISSKTTAPDQVEQGPKELPTLKKISDNMPIQTNLKVS